jgi:alpha-L-fucosidase
MRFRLTLMLVILAIFTGNSLNGQILSPGSKAGVSANQYTQRMQWWQNAKFGMFIHWGPVSLKGTEIGWSRKGPRRDRQGTGTIPVEEYDNLYRRFNPVQFDADAWVQLLKDAGMQYLVFTTKHHDGFSMFDSRWTDYKITSPDSPFGRDITAELADACHRAGVKLGFYYSQPDWRHPDFFTEHHDRYITYLHRQVEELCANYGRLDILWFDGLSNPAERWDTGRLFTRIHRLQPDIIINDRADVPADFDSPEQRIGAFQIDRPWETCMTIGRQWAWKPDDTIKSLMQCLHTLIRSVGGGGNLLFNVGPMPDGRIEPRQADQLREMGDWLKQYGESIYGTRGGPYTPDFAGVSTRKGNRIFLHILNWVNDEAPLVLPPLPRKIIRSSLLTGGNVTVQQEADGITILVPREFRREMDTIIELELDGEADTIPPLPFSSASLAMRQPADASNMIGSHTSKINLARNGPQAACDGDLFTSWNCEDDIRSVWWQVNLQTARHISKIAIFERGHAVRKFELQYQENEEWVTVHQGTEIGGRTVITFKPVQTQFVRLHILDAEQAPSIKEILLYGPDQ